MVKIRLIFLCCLLLCTQLNAQSTRWIVSLKKSSHAEKTPQKCLTEDCTTGIIVFPTLVNEATARKAIGNSNINFIEPDHSVMAQMVSNDPDVNNQWYLQNTGQNGGLANADIGVSDLWTQEVGNDSIVVGIMDSGIDWKHPDLVENVWQNLAEDIDGDGTVLFWNGSSWEFDPDDENGIDDDGNGYIDDFIGWDFVNNDNDPSDDHFSGHGTHISGIIGAKGNNGIGVSGVAWNVSLMALKFLDSNGLGYTSDAILALSYATKMGAHLSNHSWGRIGL